MSLLLDLLLRGGGGDVLDVNSAGRHDCGRVIYCESSCYVKVVL